MVRRMVVSRGAMLVEKLMKMKVFYFLEEEPHQKEKLVSPVLSVLVEVQREKKLFRLLLKRNIKVVVLRHLRKHQKNLNYRQNLGV